MKPTTLLLIASLFGNVALLAYLGTRDSAAGTPAQRSSGAPKASPASTSSDQALRAALAAGDAAAMEAAGLPADLARELALGRSFSRLADRLRNLQAAAKGDERWWRNRSNLPGAREQNLVARRELSDALVSAFGDDFGVLGGDASQLAFLPAAKRDALRRINQDYEEMMAKFSAGGLQLASDREKLRLLRAERDRDIAALLTPDERMAYEMRTSVSGATVRGRYGDAINSEAEFQKLYALQKTFDEKFPRDALTGRISPEILRARGEAERQLEQEIRSAVGDDRYAQLRRAADPDSRTLDSLATRLNLPASTTNTVLATRETLAAASQKIANDTSIPLPERRTQIQSLAAQAKADLNRVLGAEAAEAYAQRSPWVSMLQGGTAYSTTPQTGTPATLFGGSQSVYPVLPAGVTAPTGARQMIVNASPGTVDVVGGAMVDALHGPPQNVQFMTFSTSASTTTEPAGNQPRRVMIAPTDPTNAAPPTQAPTPPR